MTHPCCKHCPEDPVHDVETDQHSVPCDFCQNAALRDAISDLAEWHEGQAAESNRLANTSPNIVHSDPVAEVHEDAASRLREILTRAEGSDQ